MEAVVDKYSEPVFNPLLHLQPVKLFKEWRHMVMFLRRKNQACRSIQHRLQPADGMEWKTSQHGAAIIVKPLSEPAT